MQYSAETLAGWVECAKRGMVPVDVTPGDWIALVSALVAEQVGGHAPSPPVAASPLADLAELRALGEKMYSLNCDNANCQGERQTCVLADDFLALLDALEQKQATTAPAGAVNECEAVTLSGVPVELPGNKLGLDASSAVIAGAVGGPDDLGWWEAGGCGPLVSVAPPEPTVAVAAAKTVTLPCAVVNAALEAMFRASASDATLREAARAFNEEVLAALCERAAGKNVAG